MEKEAAEEVPVVEMTTTTTTTTATMDALPVGSVSEERDALIAPSIKEYKRRLQEAYDTQIASALKELGISHVEKASDLNEYGCRMFRTTVSCYIRQRQDTTDSMECEISPSPPGNQSDGDLQPFIGILEVTDPSMDLSETDIAAEINSQVQKCLRHTTKDLRWCMSDRVIGERIDAFVYHTTCRAVAPRVEFCTVNSDQTGIKSGGARVSMLNFLFTVDFACYEAVLPFMSAYDASDVLRWYTDSVINGLSPDRSVSRIVHGVACESSQSSNTVSGVLKLDSRTWTSRLFRARAFNAHFATLLSRMNKNRNGGATVHFNPVIQLTEDERLLVVVCTVNRYDEKSTQTPTRSTVHSQLNSVKGGLFVRDVGKLEAAIGREGLCVVQASSSSSSTPENALYICLLCRRDDNNDSHGGATAIALCNDVLPTIRSYATKGYTAVQMQFLPMPAHIQSVKPDAYPNFQCHLTIYAKKTATTETAQRGDSNVDVPLPLQAVQCCMDKSADLKRHMDILEGHINAMAKKIECSLWDIQPPSKRDTVSSPNADAKPDAGDMESPGQRVIVIEDGHCGGTIHGL